jgi:hypothetical protein
MATETVTIITNDGERFSVQCPQLRRSGTLKGLLEDLSDNHEVPLSECDGVIFGKLIKYWEHYPTDPEEKDGDSFLEFSADDVKWNNEFFELTPEGKLNNQADVLKIILAMDYLDYPRLLKHGCKIIADQIKGKTPQEICKMFNFAMPTEEQLAEAEKQINKK